MRKLQNHPIAFDVFNQLEVHKAQPEFLPTKSLRPDDLYIYPLVGLVEEWIFLGRVNTITLTPDEKYLCYHIQVSSLPKWVSLGEQIMFRQYIHYINESGAWVYSLRSYLHTIAAIMDDGGVMITLMVKHQKALVT